MGRKPSIDPKTAERLLEAYHRLGSQSAAAREIVSACSNGRKNVLPSDSETVRRIARAKLRRQDKRLEEVGSGLDGGDETGSGEGRGAQESAEAGEIHGVAGMVWWRDAGKSPRSLPMESSRPAPATSEKGFAQRRRAA